MLQKFLTAINSHEKLLARGAMVCAVIAIVLGNLLAYETWGFNKFYWIVIAVFHLYGILLGLAMHVGLDSVFCIPSNRWTKRDKAFLVFVMFIGVAGIILPLFFSGVAAGLMYVILLGGTWVIAATSWSWKGGTR